MKHNIGTRQHRLRGHLYRQDGLQNITAKPHAAALSTLAYITTHSLYHTQWCTHAYLALVDIFCSARVSCENIYMLLFYNAPHLIGYSRLLWLQQIYCTLCRARLVLRWLSVCWYAALVIDQANLAIQHGLPTDSKHNEQ